MLFSLDRIENGAAVLVDDDGESVIVPLSLFPEGAYEGMVYRKHGDGYVADLAEVQRRREHIREMQNRLRRKK